jgi:DNA-binding NtrC family response regulator
MFPASVGQDTTGRAAETSRVDDRVVGEGAARLVLVHDPDATNDRALDDALASCALLPRRIRDTAALERARRSDDCGIALVAVGADARELLAREDAVSVLKRKGYTVLCFLDGAGRWALGAQCRLLLAGASHLLDATGPAFALELRDHLTRLLDAEDERRGGDRRLQAEMGELGIVGRGPAVTSLFEWIRRASPLSELPVLISGETGTGKELVARAIHRLDPRRSRGPFVAVNCSAISASLAESELFGHGRGAFTGAEQARKGLVRSANGGVLFLDEIGDLDASLQGKFLRVLQERRVLSLGHDQETPVDVRVIAATHRDLPDLVRRQAFRADLLHRLDVLSVRLPALRERPEDVEPLVRHFMARSSREPESAMSASRDFVRALQRVELPGNVRQLENVVRRAMVTWKRGDPLRLSDLPPELWLELAHLAGAQKPDAETGAEPESTTPSGPAPLLDAVGVLEACSWQLGRALDLCEQKIVGAALGVSSGNRSRAARLLGISPRSIFNKLRKYHLAI